MLKDLTPSVRIAAGSTLTATIQLPETQQNDKRKAAYVNITISMCMKTFIPASMEYFDAGNEQNFELLESHVFGKIILKF